MTKPFSAVPQHVIDDLMDHAMNAPEGCFVEVGVYQGGTAWHLAQVARKKGARLFLYDTFTGIPYRDAIDAHKPGDFNDTSAEQVRRAIPDAEVVEGLFPDSIVQMPHVAFAHIDCDQYRAIKESVAALTPLMAPGGIMVFDDYGCLDGATKAVQECFPAERINTTHCGKALVRF